MADRTARGAASEVVAEVLKVTPVHPAHGDMLIGWRSEEHEAGGIHWPIYGEPEPIAARQAAAVIRKLAEHRRVNGGYPAWTPGELDELADEIDGGTDATH